MKAVILAGGLGTRLRPLTFAIPKPLLPVGDTPILEIILSRLKQYGICDVILAINYRGTLIETYFGDGSKFDTRIEYLREEQPLGTAGPLMSLKGRFSEPFLVMNGDILTGIDFAKLAAFHTSAGSDLTVAVTQHRHELAFGVVALGGDGVTITRIHERPSFSYEISAGIYMLSPSVLDFIPEKGKYDMPDLIARLIKAGRKVSAYHFSEFWLAIERMDDYEQAINDMGEWLDQRTRRGHISDPYNEE